jgi:hypothetical protein
MSTENHCPKCGIEYALGSAGPKIDEHVFYLSCEHIEDLQAGDPIHPSFPNPFSCPALRPATHRLQTSIGVDVPAPLRSKKSRRLARRARVGNGAV